MGTLMTRSASLTASSDTPAFDQLLRAAPSPCG